MLILSSPSGTPVWILYLKSDISEKHGVVFKALAPLTSTLQVEIPNSHTNVTIGCLLAGVESNL